MAVHKATSRMVNPAGWMGSYCPVSKKRLRPSRALRGRKASAAAGRGTNAPFPDTPWAYSWSRHATQERKRTKPSWIRRCRRAEEKGCMKILQKRERSERMPEFLSILRAALSTVETSGWRGESEVSRGNIPKDFSFLLSTELLRKILERARMLQKNDKEEARSSIPNKKISD